MKSRPIALAASVALACAGLATSCATSVPLRVMKPAEIDMSDAKIIAVLDFDYPREERASDPLGILYLALTNQENVKKGTPQEKLADYFTRLLIQALRDTDYFDVRDSDSVLAAMGGKAAGADAIAIGKSSGVQAIVTGRIVDMERSQEYEIRQETIKDKDSGAKTVVPVNYLVIEDSVSMEYRVISAKNGRILATRSFAGRQIQELAEKNWKKAISQEDQGRAIVEGWAGQIARQLAPYMVTESRSLMKDKAKDGNMEFADALVKNGSYEKALKVYLEVWEGSANVAAGVNAAIMYEVLGKLDLAVSMAKQVASATSDRRANAELARLQRAKAEAERLAEQIE